MQANSKTDEEVQTALEKMLAGPAAQDKLFESMLKPRVKLLTADAKQQDNVATAAQDAWIKATADVNKVCLPWCSLF